MSHFELRITKTEAARRAGVNRKTIQRWVGRGGISEDAQRRVFLSEVTAYLKEPVFRESDGCKYDRLKARPGKAYKPRRIYRAPVADIEHAAKVGEWEGIDFLRVREVYNSLRIRGAEFAPGLKLQRPYPGRIELVIERQKTLRRAARKARLGKPVSAADRRKVEKVLENWSSGLAMLASSFHRLHHEFLDQFFRAVEMAEFDPSKVREFRDRCLEECGHADWMTPVDVLDAKEWVPEELALVDEHGLDFSQLHDYSENFVDCMNKTGELLVRELIAYWLIEKLFERLAPAFVNDFMHNLVELSGVEEKEKQKKPRSLLAINERARKLKISPQALHKRIRDGLDRLSFHDPKLVKELEAYRRGYTRRRTPGRITF